MYEPNSLTAWLRQVWRRWEESTRFPLHWLILLLLLWLLVGCKSTAPIPSHALVELRQQVEQVDGFTSETLEAQRSAAYQRYLESLGKLENAAPLLLEKPPSADEPKNDFFVLAYPGETELYRQLDEAQAALSQSHGLIVDYVNLLIAINGSNSSGQSFDSAAYAAEFGRITRSLVATTGASVSGPEVDAASRLGAEAIALWLRKKRRESLAEVMRLAQPAIQSWASRSQQLMQINALGITQEYQLQFRKLAAGLPGVSDAEQRERMRAIVQLNAQTLESLENLWQAWRVYDRWPRKHARTAQNIRAGLLGYLPKPDAASISAGQSAGQGQ